MIYKNKILGMSCEHCEKNVKDLISKQSVFKNFTISHTDGILQYDSDKDQIKLLSSILKDTEYNVVKYQDNKFLTYASYLIIIVTFLLISNRVYNKFDLTTFSDSFTLISVFLFGIITSFHCVGMCGGIALSQTKLESKKKNILNSLLYNSGRVLTYTVLGFILGLIGTAFTITPQMRSIMFFIIGSIMLLLGFNNLGIIKFNLKKLKLIYHPN